MPMTQMNSSGLADQVRRSRWQTELTNIDEIFIPKEERKKTNCCWRLLCPCYYLFCCCCCCETGMKITKLRFISRFQKWITIVSPPPLTLSEQDPLPRQPH